MSDIVEFTMPGTGQPAIGKIIDFKKPEFSPFPMNMLDEISVKAVQDKAGNWSRYGDFYDFQLVPVTDLTRSSWSAAQKRMVPRAARARRRRIAMQMLGWKVLHAIEADPQLTKHFFDMLVELAADLDLEVSEELSPYEYSEAVGLLGDEMEKVLGRKFRQVDDWHEVAQSYVDKKKDTVEKILYTTLGKTQRGKRSMKQPRHRRNRNRNRPRFAARRREALRSRRRPGRTATTLRRLHRRRRVGGFMEPEILYDWWVIIDGPYGGEATPAEFVDTDEVEKIIRELDRSDEPFSIRGTSLEDYFENHEVYEVELIQGYGARMQAPGYLDSTPWTVFDTEREAEEYLREMYMDEDY